MKFLVNDLGYLYETDSCIVFFGNKTASYEKITTHFKQYSFLKVKQMHSDIVVEASSNILEADAHFTNKKNTALLIATADCAPVFIQCQQTQRVAAIHAGWRGVANQITFKTLNRLTQTGSDQKKFNFWIGPHILQDSFEVNEDVFKELKSASFNLSEANLYFKKDDKYFVSLINVLKSQIQKFLNSTTINSKNFSFLEIDTKSNIEFNSYRRNKEIAERNLSFIVLK